MNNDLFFEGKKFISSKRAAKIGGYSNDYIGQLCRGGKVDSRMVGRTWYVSYDSLISHKSLNSGVNLSRKNKAPKLLKKSEILALEETANESPVSEEINFDAPVSAPQEVSLPNTVVESKPEFIYVNDDKELFPSLNKNTYEEKEVFFTPVTVKKVEEVIVPERKVVSHKNVPARVISPFVKSIAGGVVLTMSIWFIVSFVNVNNLFIFNSQTAAIEKSEGNLAINFYRGLKDFIKGARLRILVLIGGEKYAINAVDNSDSTNSEEGPNQGLVVVPKDYQEDSSRTISRIKDTFSDEVNIVPNEDGESGVIKPVFKTVSKDEYLYVLVPLKN